MEIKSVNIFNSANIKVPRAYDYLNPGLADPNPLLWPIVGSYDQITKNRQQFREFG